jgi:hypothetical protein
MSEAIVRQVAELARMPIDKLRGRWEVLYGTPPPGNNRDYLVRRLAYRIQELAFGGLEESTRQKLREAAERADEKPAPRKRREGLPVAGTRLVREWNGRRYEVTVTADGVVYDGRPYRSLTAVAKAITGAHWNGRAFFGLKRQGKEGGS